ncbi:hypothetical protein [Hydrogenophaga pseudoflava]|uniref:hypothetical protein n=1 Tax=Hydrogenophaga pseudoflava TaxID=47421 RepID=UPI0027E53697|nr:hypothetical protein [Hydrogenophaga pseudoflava]MDQ7747037.1 hypothetical protein [Hydrogenophaga pseudoflava]
MEALVIGLFWVLAVRVLIGSTRTGLSIFFGSIPFGALAVVPTNLTGGLTLTPTPIIALLIGLRLLLNRDDRSALARIALSKSGTVYLTAFWLVACAATLLMPRIFEGEVTIFPVRSAEMIVEELLHPTTQNISQLAYLSVSVFGVFCFVRLTSRHFNVADLLGPIRVGAFITVATGALDYASNFVNLDALLDPFRTATYALLTTNEVFGNKRTVGLTPEASSYGAVCVFFLSLLYFLRLSVHKDPLGYAKNMALVLALVLMALLSTSSAAMVCVGVFMVLVLVDWLWGDVSVRKTPFTKTALLWCCALSLVALFLSFQPRLLSELTDIFNHMVVYKKESQSYEERTLWTTVSLQALQDTHGLGVGVGGTRTSSFLAALFSNTGVLGGLLFMTFLLKALLGRWNYYRSPGLKAVQRGLFFAFIPPFVNLLLVGTSADFGLALAYILGLKLGLVAKYPARAAELRMEPLAQGAR